MRHGRRKLRNAIPRESVAHVALAKNELSNVLAAFKEISTTLKNEFSVTEPNAEIVHEELAVKPLKMMAKQDQAKIIATIYTTPNGVWKMNEHIEGLVETSSSLAKVKAENGTFITKSLQRSMSESGKTDIANALRLTYELMGAEVTQSGDYPGWSPNPSSLLVKMFEEKYKSMFNESPKIAACHAGLECGILSKHLPDCDMISFGPTIRNPHSPDEKVAIKSVQKFWSFLLAVLEEIPTKN